MRARVCVRAVHQGMASRRVHRPTEPTDQPAVVDTHEFTTPAQPSSSALAYRPAVVDTHTCTTLPHPSSAQPIPSQQQRAPLTYRTTAKRRMAKERRQMSPRTANLTTVGMPDRSYWCGWWVWFGGGGRKERVSESRGDLVFTAHLRTTHPDHPPATETQDTSPRNRSQHDHNHATHPIALDARVPTAQPAPRRGERRRSRALAAGTASEEVEDPAAAAAALLLLLVVRLGRHGCCPVRLVECVGCV